MTDRARIVDLTPVEKARLRTLGAAHLALAAVANLAAGLALLSLGLSDRLTRLAFLGLETYATGQTIVKEADAVVFVTTTGATLVGVALLAVGAAGALAATDVVRDRRRRWWAPASVVSGLNPLAAPLSFIAVVFLQLGRTAGNR